MEDEIMSVTKHANLRCWHSKMRNGRQLGYHNHPSHITTLSPKCQNNPYHRPVLVPHFPPHRWPPNSKFPKDKGKIKKT